MIAARAYNEGDGFELRADFTDHEGTPTFPASVKWRVVCDSTDREVLGWDEALVKLDSDPVEGVAAYYVDIEVPGSANSIQNRRNRSETKRVEVAADLGDDRQYSEAYVYLVNRRT